MPGASRPTRICAPAASDCREMGGVVVAAEAERLVLLETLAHGGPAGIGFIFCSSARQAATGRLSSRKTLSSCRGSKWTSRLPRPPRRSRRPGRSRCCEQHRVGVVAVELEAAAVAFDRAAHAVLVFLVAGERLWSCPCGRGRSRRRRPRPRPLAEAPDSSARSSGFQFSASCRRRASGRRGGWCLLLGVAGQMAAV